jgi:hypothetical protein
VAAAEQKTKCRIRATAVLLYYVTQRNLWKDCIFFECLFLHIFRTLVPTSLLRKAAMLFIDGRKFSVICPNDLGETATRICKFNITFQIRKLSVVEPICHKYIEVDVLCHFLQVQAKICCVVMPCRVNTVAVRSYHITIQRHNPEDLDLNFHRCVKTSNVASLQTFPHSP